ncbi:hypothetical protein EC912_10339 [Luteibacter rhizovicinus]|uniref:Uncharacterized protein n=1 Tax=Luteibacter rhizovicinus TaxID=242606 RepID=A0A4R3YQC2_9GAMM|nr:hypothetical protein EC912_10339 [Luteibacter rhizovicinus]
MSIVEFEGQLCYEKPLSESAGWICEHLKPLLASNGQRDPPTVLRILVGGNKSSEVFLFASECSDSEFLSDTAVMASLIKGRDRIGCNSCGTTLIFEC